MKGTRKGSVSSLSRCDLWFIPTNGMKMNVRPGEWKGTEGKAGRERNESSPQNYTLFAIKLTWCDCGGFPLNLTNGIFCFLRRKPAITLLFFMFFNTPSVCLSSLTTMDVVIISCALVPLLFISSILFFDNVYFLHKLWTLERPNKNDFTDYKQLRLIFIL